MSEASSEIDPNEGVVSVVLVNYKGADDTVTCIDGLRKLAWPA